MVQPQPSGGEGGELGCDLRPKLPAHAGIEIVSYAQAKLVGGKLAIRAEEAGNALTAQHGGPLDHHQMQADPQARHPLRTLNRIRRRSPCHHQAGRAQDAVAVGALDRRVDRRGEAEIARRAPSPAVTAAAQAALFRSRMNWKNSTPSRSRRFIICGLRTISLTMDAIFGARK